MLFKLLGLPFTLPAAGIKFCFEKIAELAENELNDDSVLKEQLMLLQLQLEEGEIDEDEYTEKEAVIMIRLRLIRERRQALAREQMAAEADHHLVSERTGTRHMVVETFLDDDER